MGCGGCGGKIGPMIISNSKPKLRPPTIKPLPKPIKVTPKTGIQIKPPRLLLSPSKVVLKGKCPLCQQQVIEVGKKNNRIEMRCTNRSCSHTFLI